MVLRGIKIPLCH